VKVKIAEITRSNFDNIPRLANHHFNCQECFYWMGKKDGRANLVKHKQNWFHQKSRRYNGSLGKILLWGKRENPVGFIQFGPIFEFETAQLFYRGKDEDDHHFTKDRPPAPKEGWCITCVAIRTPYRGKGLATRLVRNVLRDLKRRKVKVVDAYPLKKVNSWNQTSSGPLRLWEKCGFREIGRVGYFKGEPIPPEGQEVLIMRRQW